MIGASLVKKLFGSRNERVVRQLSKVVIQINALESAFERLSDAEIRAKTDEFRQRFQQGETLDALLPEAFALVREASKRTLKLRHFDVQLIGGMVLHQGKIAEMGTGEGKTLMATLAAYLNSLTGKGLHIITVNDYLAKRDAEWMGPIFQMLGLTVGVNLTNLPQQEKRQAYAADITYGTNNEFGFDYLRDNMVFNLEEKVQRGLNYVIVDEVDSILIDEARTPLIISGPAEESSELYVRINALIPALKKQLSEGGDGDYSVDEKTKQAYLTESGHDHAEKLFVQHGILTKGESLYAPANIIFMHHLTACLRAHALFHRDVDYIVANNEIVIVDEHTGRTMQGRRWSDGLHQAVEAKEGLAVQNENQTLASITFQNYFRMYKKIAGMTGTADTEAYEFQHIYGLEVVVIPTNKPVIRKDAPDQIYLTQREKFAAVIEDIKTCRERKQPILVGTASIEASELLSNLLQQEKIPHQVLNAKYHEKEAQIIAEAGRPGAVTIATNMAGRGTDIVLGGNLAAEIKVLEEPSSEIIVKLEADWQERHKTAIAAGGLHVIGSERHEARRIDNQLRGRCGRQGDPGSSRFYLSLEDNLLRIFASDRLGAIMQKLGMKENEPIEHSWVTKAIENAQRKVEGHNFDIRKQLLEFDDVANEQRHVIYEQRDTLLTATDTSEMVAAIRSDVINQLIDTFIPPGSLEEQWDIPGLESQLETDLGLKLNLKASLEADNYLDEEKLRAHILNEVITVYQFKIENLAPDVVKHLEKSVMLQTLDSNWREHLAAMDYLRQGIYLRGYAQKNPKQEYKREAFLLFSSMLDRFKYETISLLSKIKIEREEEARALEPQPIMNAQMRFEHPSIAAMAAGAGVGVSAGEEVFAQEDGSERNLPFTRQQPKVGRNDPCPCGSGKKYKQCHGQLQ